MTTVTGLRRISRVLRAAGATLVAMPEKLYAGPPPSEAILGAFKSSVNDYLRDRGPTSPQHSLDDVIAFNRANGKQAVRFGQEFLLRAAPIGEAGQRRAFRQLKAYRHKAHRVLQAAMGGHHLDAILSPRFIAAVTATSAGHPTVTVPAGYQDRTPYGLVLIGQRFSEPKLIGYAYDFERRTHAHRSPAAINPQFAAACRR